MQHVSGLGYVPLAGENPYHQRIAPSKQQVGAAADALVEQAHARDPALFAAVKRVLQMCRVHALPFSQVMSERGISGEVPLIALLQGRDKQVLKLVYSALPEGWLVANRVQKEGSRLLLWEPDGSGRARGIEWSGGCTYVGEFLHKKRSGYGRFSLSPAVYFDGEFQNDRMHGRFDCYDSSRRPAGYAAMYIEDRYCGELPASGINATNRSLSSVLAKFISSEKSK